MVITKSNLSFRAERAGSLSDTAELNENGLLWKKELASASELICSILKTGWLTHF
jgi:hypothetical protein